MSYWRICDHHRIGFLERNLSILTEGIDERVVEDLTFDDISLTLQLLAACGSGI